MACLLFFAVDAFVLNVWIAWLATQSTIPRRQASRYLQEAILSRGSEFRSSCRKA
jgi:hypothetical protein